MSHPHPRHTLPPRAWQSECWFRGGCTASVCLRSAPARGSGSRRAPSSSANSAGWPLGLRTGVLCGSRCPNPSATLFVLGRGLFPMPEESPQKQPAFKPGQLPQQAAVSA